MNKVLSLIAFLIMPLVSSYAQEVEVTPEELGNSYAIKGYNFYFDNSIDSAIYYTTKATSVYETEELWEHYICSLNNLSKFYHINKQQGKALKEIIFNSYNLSKTHLKPYNQCYIWAVSNISQYYFSIGNNSKSIAIQKEALALNLKYKDLKSSAIAMYSNLGNSYKYSGDYQNAHSYFKQALRLQLDTLPNSPLIAEIYHDIGRVFQLENQIDSAILYLNKEEQVLRSIHKNNSLYFERKIHNYLFLAELWSEKKNWQKVDTYINKTLQLPINEYYQVLKHEKLAKIELYKLNYLEATRELEKGQLIAEKFDKRNIPSMKSRRLIDLANAYYNLGKYNDAISNYQNILITLSPDFENTDFQSNPKSSQLFAKPTALKALNGKAKTLQKIYYQKKDSSYLNAAFNTYLTATQLIRNMRQGYLNIEAKNTLAEKSVAIYEGAIQCALTLFDLTKDEKYKSEALALAESNKALLLLENLNEQTAKGFSSIPDSLLEKEKDLKLNLAYLQKIALKEKTSNLKDDIFDLQQELEKFTSNLEKNYPRYFELKYQNEPIPLKAIQAKLNQSALLEYFAGEENIYLFIVTPNGLDIKTIKNKASIYDNIAKLRTALNTVPGSINAQMEFEQFTTAANSLYNLLLKSALDQLPSDINSLTIIPDYQLNYIPFDVLLREAANPELPGYSATSLEYLMEQYAISYHYSATLLHKDQQREEQNYQYEFIGYAPSFKSGRNMATRSCSSDELYSLSCSDDEVRSISSLFKGITHLGPQANKETFESAAGSSQILHLATHACIDEENSNVNKIFLTDDFLSNYDLYNMNLNAELAVLSACNTGSGELVKGEGVMSLARGFINAGCASTLMSMWSVDDCATSDIMLRFYEGLKNKLPKDQALREAKLSYLDNASKSKTHPYYWAAFVQFGDISALDLKQSFDFRYLLATVGILLALGLFFKNKYH